MFTLKFNFIFILLIITIAHAVPTFAESEGESVSAGQKKGKIPNLPEWAGVQNRLLKIEAKIKLKRETLEKLIKDKKALPANSPKLQGIISEMISAHKELLQLSKDLEKESTILKYRYPERGASIDRKYKPVEVRSLDQMEQEIGLDDKLSRNQNKIKALYERDSNATSDTAGKKTQPEPVTPKEDVSPIILKK